MDGLHPLTHMDSGLGIIHVYEAWGTVVDVIIRDMA